MFVFGMFGMFETFGTFWSLKDFFVSFTFFFFIRFFYHLLHFGERFSGDNSSYRKTVVVGTAGKLEKARSANPLNRNWVHSPPLAASYILR